MQPGPGTGPIQCVLTRARRGAKLFPEYALHLELGGRFLLAARKRRKSAGAHYLLSRDGQARARALQAGGAPQASLRVLSAVCRAMRRSCTLSSLQYTACGAGRLPAEAQAAQDCHWQGWQAAWLLQVCERPAEAALHAHAMASNRATYSRSQCQTRPAQDLSRGGDSFCGKVRANFVGTEFVFYDRGAKPGGLDLAPSAPPAAPLHSHDVDGDSKVASCCPALTAQQQGRFLHTLSARLAVLVDLISGSISCR